MARAREFDPHEALGKAVEVFWAKGYFDTSMDDLVSAMGVARYGVYSQWGNKRELFIAALEAFAEQGAKQHHGDLLKDDAGLDDIRNFFNGLIDHIDELKNGCLVCTAASEIAPQDPEIAQTVVRIFDRFKNAIKNPLTNALKTGEFNTDQDIDDLAEYFAALFRSIALMARGGFSVDQIASTIKVGLSVLDK